LQDSISKKSSTKKDWWSGSKHRPWVQAPVLQKRKERSTDWCQTIHVQVISLPPTWCDVIYIICDYIFIRYNNILILELFWNLNENSYVKHELHAAFGFLNLPNFT
jgi:hypothetical protein